MFLYYACKHNPEKPNIFAVAVVYAIIAYTLYTFNQTTAMLALGVIAIYDINAFVIASQAKNNTSNNIIPITIDSVINKALNENNVIADLDIADYTNNTNN